MIFIIGCGRSGTHLLADVLKCKHTDVRIEERPQFPLSISIARNMQRKADLYPILYERYRETLAESNGKLLVDKTQTNMWIAETLADDFPAAKFIGIERKLLPVISSTLLHDGFELNMGFALSFSMPCPWFGIFDHSWYILPAELAYTMRWLAHKAEMRRLAGILGPRLLVVQYEDLVRRPHEIRKRLELHFGWSTMPECRLSWEPFEGIDAAPLKKWRQNLTEEQIRGIEDCGRNMAPYVDKKIKEWATTRS